MRRQMSHRYCWNQLLAIPDSRGMGEALNVGFFAAKPDKRLVDASAIGLQFGFRAAYC